MSVTIDSFGAQQNGSSISSLTLSHTVAGVNRLMTVAVVGFFSPFGGLPTLTVTYGGAPLTLKTNVTFNSNSNVYLYYLVAPAIGTANVVVSFSSSGVIHAQVCSWNGVDQTAPFGTVSTGNGVDSVDVTSYWGNMVIDAVVLNGGGTLTAASGQNQISTGDTGSVAMGTSCKPGANGVVSMGWSPATTMIGVSLIANNQSSIQSSVRVYVEQVISVELQIL